METLPREIVTYVATQLVGHRMDMEFPELWVAVQLYSCCKSFNWLSELYYTLPTSNEYSEGFFTVNLFGKAVGPCIRRAKI